MKKIIRRPVSSDELTLLSTLHPTLQRIYLARGIKETELNRTLDQLIPYYNLLDIEKAVSYLFQALANQEAIMVVGDFDTDGATSTALAVRALRSFGAKNIAFLVPNRFEFGYGLTPELVAIAKNTQPKLILTVDNGIANHEGVIAAKEAGMRVIITDHHLPAATLPPADAIVNPNQLNDPFPSKNMAGVGVIFYVMSALRRHLVNMNWFQKNNLPEPKMSDLLDLVALGTVADVVPLDHNNRILVHQGLARIRSGRCAPGIIALLEIAGRNPQQVVSQDLGFAVAPRLNAAGRLEDMSLGIACLLTDDKQEATRIALQLNQLNQDRRLIESDMQEQAFAILKKMQKQLLPSGICVFDEGWHQGVIGILASRLKEHFYRPTIVFAPGHDNDIKGSARSIPGFHIRDILAQIAIAHPDIIQKFGGHAMAAGLTITRDSFEKFAALFDQAIKSHGDITYQILQSDGELSAEDMTLTMAELLRHAGPWGQGFPEPLFDDRFTIVEQTLLAGKHLKLRVQKDNKILSAIAFNVDLTQWPNHRCQSASLAYRLDINEYKGKKNLQLIVEHIEA